MAELAQRIEEELSQAFEVKDEGALRRYARLIEEHSVDRPTFNLFGNDINRTLTTLQSDVRVLAETIKQGLGFAEKRFEQIDKRFEQVDKRLEQVDKRFEEVDRRFARLQWGLTFGFTVLAVLIAVFGLLA